MKLQTFTDEKSWVLAASSYLLEDGVRNIGLSGGSTPGKVYKAFAQSAPKDTSYTFVQIDERMVLPDHADSNQRQAKEALAPVLDQSVFITVPTEYNDDTAVKLYEKKVSNALPLDIAVLGIGPDGHTASLFPHAKALQSEAVVAHTTTNQFAVRDRITLTFSAIMQSKTLLVLLKGKEKRAIVNTLQSQLVSVMNFPAIKLLDHPNLHILYLDI